jgi:copper chaperone CopZ
LIIISAKGMITVEDVCLFLFILSAYVGVAVHNKETFYMETTTLQLPAMYADHHVIEVRRLLSELPGVENVYASSCFQMVEVQYDETRLSIDAIKARLEEAGYLDEMPVPVERGADTPQANGQVFFRHTAALETSSVVTFAQEVPYAGRPLWPCPGLGTLAWDEEVTDG